MTTAEDRRRILTIERLAARAWPPKETREHEGWVFRQIGGFTHRANSVLAIAAAEDQDVEAAIEAAEAFYKSHGQEACFQIPDITAPEDLDHRLQSRGYDDLSPTDVMWCPLDELTLPGGGNLKVVHSSVADDDWIAVRAADLRPGEEGLLRELAARVPARCIFATAYDGEKPVGAGMMVLEEGWAGLFALEAVAAARRRGVGRAVFRSLTDWARENGALRYYLQVEQRNPPARQLFTKAGFRKSHAYHYRSKVV